MYLLDANIFISASRQYYSFDLAPTFWSWLEEQFYTGTMASINHVYQELTKGNDQLAGWAKQPQLKDVWLEPDVPAFTKITELMTWVEAPTSQFTHAAVDTFANSADLLLIAQAAAGNHTILTHEVSRPQAKKQVFIPDAAAHLGVTCTQPFKTFQKLGLKL